MTNYQAQKRAINQAAFELEKVLATRDYNDIKRNDLEMQLDALKDAIISLEKLEQLSKLLESIINA